MFINLFIIDNFVKLNLLFKYINYQIDKINFKREWSKKNKYQMFLKFLYIKYYVIVSI